MWSLIAGIGSSAAGMLGFKSLQTKMARIVGIIVVAVALIAIFNIGKCAYDRSIINEHETEQRAEDAEAALEADRIADDAEYERIEAMEVENERLEQAAAEAARADPVGAAKPVGPVSQSYYDNLPPKKGTNR